jgi:hypothetical protein
VELSQVEAGESMEQGGEERPIGSGEAGFVDLRGHLIPFRDDLA